MVRPPIARPMAACLALAAAGLDAPAALAGTVTLTPTKDNTLFETFDGSQSNGLGSVFFAGRSGFFAGGPARRAVLAFDVAGSVPAGATITAASLTLHLVQTSEQGVESEHTLHRLLADWGEGTSSTDVGLGAPSTPNDATWLHTFYPNQFWDAEGGDYDATVSGSATVGTTAPADVTWESTAQMAADVQGWLDDPASNFGWILIGDESQLFTAKKFASVQNPEESIRPYVVIDYACLADLDGGDDVGFSDLLVLLASWGPCPPVGPCRADLDHNGYVGFSDLLILLGAWGPC